MIDIQNSHKEENHKTFLKLQNNNLTFPIDIFVHIVDNYGDMGFVCEFIQACKNEFINQYAYIIWTDNLLKMEEFARQSGISDVSIVDIVEFYPEYSGRKSAIGISLLHAPIPDLHCFEEKALILRIDYLSLDPIWIGNNEREHILSTSDRRIIELIPSPLEVSAGLIPVSNSEREIVSERHIVIFTYSDTLSRIDWDSFPDDIQIFVFGKIESKRENIFLLDFLPPSEFYLLLDTSEFVIIRGEVTFAHMIQTRVPFFWNIYSDIGGFPSEQSEQYLSMMNASSEYRDIHSILNNQKSGKISYQDCIGVLSHGGLPLSRIDNLIHTVKKHIDRFNNSI